MVDGRRATAQAITLALEFTVVKTIWSKQDKLPLASRVANEIRRAILEGKLSAGERLVETNLASDMGVSRATVRDAFRQLEREGLVAVVPWRGASVIGLSERDISEVASLRATLEAFAVELAIPRLSPKDEAALEACIERMAKEVEQGNLAGLNEADYDFHRTIWERAGHRYLLQALESLSPTIRALISVSNLVYPALEATALEHEKILRAMVSGRLGLAKRAIHAHAIRFGELALREIQRRSRLQSGEGALSKSGGRQVRSVVRAFSGSCFPNAPRLKGGGHGSAED